MKIYRIKKIEEYIFNNETVNLDTLCEVFKISKNTVRRDINELVKKGSVKKVYGGVTAYTNKLVSYEERNIKNKNQKIAIAKAAASYLNDGDVIYMDAGTTTVNMVNFLNKKNITIITNNLNVIIEAKQFSNI